MHAKEKFWISGQLLEQGLRALFVVVTLCTPIGYALANDASNATPEHIMVLQSESNGPYAEFTESLRHTLRENNPQIVSDVKVMTWDADLQSQLIGLNTSDLLVVVGTRATTAALHSNTRASILSVLVPRPAAEQLSGQPGNPTHRLGIIYLDQPMARYLDLARLIMPRNGKIGVVLGPTTETESTALKLAASKIHTDLVIAIMQPGKINPLTALQSIIRNSNVILALPDPMVYNRYTLSPLLLTTFRYRTPVIGFSASFVNAGAVAGIYSKPAQIGQQAAEMILQQDLAPGGRYPQYFTVSFNRKVAAALDITLPSKEEAEAKLRNQADNQ